MAKACPTSLVLKKIVSSPRLSTQSPPVIRPFSLHLGDMRTGREVVEQASKDLDESLNDIQQSSEAGMRLLQEVDRLGPCPPHCHSTLDPKP